MTASALRAISTSDRPAPRPAVSKHSGPAPDSAIRFSKPPSGHNAALTAALRRSREVLEVLDRRMAIRDTLSFTRR